MWRRRRRRRKREKLTQKNLNHRKSELRRSNVCKPKVDDELVQELETLVALGAFGILGAGADACVGGGGGGGGGDHGGGVVVVDVTLQCSMVKHLFLLKLIV